MAVAVLTNMFELIWPKLVTVAIMTAPIKATNKPYSTALTPVSSLKKAIIVSEMIFSIHGTLSNLLTKRNRRSC